MQRRRKPLEIGQTVHNWTVISPPIDPDARTLTYDVICKCGALGKKSLGDMRKFNACKQCNEFKYSPGKRFGRRTILEPVSKPESKGKHFLVECDCGRIFTCRSDRLNGACGYACRNFTDVFLEEGYSGVGRFCDTHPWQSWINMCRQGGVCEAWEVFPPFLRWYLKVTGKTIEQVLANDLTQNVITFRRINTEKNWEPGNIEVRKFFTERARDHNTYQLWKRLFDKDLLHPDLHTYLAFVTAFGTKDANYDLRRHDYSERHSALNSYWSRRSSGDTP